ncbi:MAG: hypothetical protein IPF94_10575 [Betaproteobacteria bacterium]|nr:hypothetical protein [Betaproteobacteria bacterium]
MSGVALQVLLITVLRWLLRHLLSLALIIVVLLLGRAGWVEWQAWQSMRAESAQLIDVERIISASLQKLALEVNARAAGLQTAALATLEERITAVDSDIARKRLERQPFAGLAPIFGGQSIARAQLQAMQIDGAIGLLQQERNWLQDAKLRLLATQSAQAQRVELERLRQRHAGLYVQWQAVGQEREALKQEHWVTSRVPGTAEYQQIQALNEQRAKLLTDNQRAEADYRRQLALVNGARALTPLPPLALPPGAVNDALQPLRARMDDLRKLERVNWVGKLWRPVQEVLPTALLILLGVILMPFAIKALFYFVLAPLAARQPPVRLLPDSDGVLTLETGESSVSRAVTVDSAHELLVHPEFLQSASVAGEKTTQWLLNWRFALTSLSAGMVALTRIRCEVPEVFVISATHNALAEIGVLILPAGSAVVMQPHNLVGVMQPRDMPLRITSHWRLTSLHAWLTLQLRYLALHGPARLIVQGCRGVRLEPATGGRAINQAATIAFSANLPYSTRRCETFAAYLLGQQELLNDCFGGSRDAGVNQTRNAGFFAYQEMPHADRRAGITGRGLEGLTDSVLKVMGV